MSNATVTGGRAPSSSLAGGGGFLNRGRLTLRNCTVSGNSAAVGGGGLSNPTGILTVLDSSISANAGGGIKSAVGTLSVSNSTISANLGVFGVGIDSGGPTEILGSTVSGNAAAGITTFGDTEIRNSTISGNGAGGVRLGGTSSVTDSTITGNLVSISRGGGLYLRDGGTFSIVRNIIAGNQATFGYSAEVSRQAGSSGSLTLSRNLLGHSGMNNAGAFHNFSPGASDITATSNGTKPRALTAILDNALADNGGPTRTHALPDASPAINAGGTTCSATDQRGLTRPQGTACDIGAFEDEATVAVPSVRVGDASIAEGAESTCNLRFTVSLSRAASAPVRVNFVTENASASAGSDYVAKNGSLNFSAGQRTKFIDIAVKGNRTAESNDTFRVRLR
ncbi:MAG: choice-of-anchor Q domain-containing protein [Panacagrimonas sp.]